MREGRDLEASIAPARVLRAAADVGLALPASALPTCTDARCLPGQRVSTPTPHAEPPHAAAGRAAPGMLRWAWGGAEAIWVIWVISAAISAAAARGAAVVPGGAPPPPPCAWR